jgi:glucosylceramidase
VIVFNEGKIKKNFKIRLGDKETAIYINPQAIQTIVIPTKIN